MSALTVRVRRGALLRWRWFLYQGKRYRGAGPVRGFLTKQAAQRDAQEVLGAGVTAADPDGYELYAGPRDFE